MRKVFQAAERQVSITVGVRIPALVTRAASMLPADREVQDQALYAVALVATVVSIIAGCR